MTEKSFIRFSNHSDVYVHFFVSEYFPKVFSEFCPVCVLVVLNLLVELKVHLEYFGFCLWLPELFIHVWRWVFPWFLAPRWFDSNIGMPCFEFFHFSKKLEVTFIGIGHFVDCPGLTVVCNWCQSVWFGFIY